MGAIENFDTFTRLEQCLLPPPEIIRWNKGNLTIETYTTPQKVAYCVGNFFAFSALLLVSPFTLIYDWWTKKKVEPIQKTPDIAPAPPTWPPAQRGFATSLFQTAGLGTKWSAVPGLEGKCDWDGWMDNPKHVIHPEGFDYRDFYTDVISDPTVYIQMLKQHNVTAHRFSLEWSVIEPRPGEIDNKAVALYQNFIQKLLEAGITPSVTLSHFVVPEWFYKQGNFQKVENIDAYVRFALRAMELFPQVKDWWSFNELGVKAFQQAREVYPTDLPEGSSLSNRVYAAGIATCNMLIAHCKLHEQVAKLHPDKTLGVTHQWLKFDASTENCLERLSRHLFEQVTFWPVYNFFKNGKFSFQSPFQANIQFEVPKKEFEDNGHFLMRLGVQAYPKPMLKMGFNWGGKPPCAPGSMQNFLVTFGSACEPGGAVMRFGPRHRAEGIDEILDEAFAITDNVAITEFGSDANVYQWGKKGFAFNEETQAAYLKQLVERIRDYCLRKGVELKAILAWTDLIRQQEWENGLECRLGMIDPILNEKRQLIGWASTPSSHYLAKAYQPSMQREVVAS